MRSFAEFIAESLNSNANLVWDWSRRSQPTATFSVAANKTVVSFEQRDTKAPWHVVFEVDQTIDTTAAVHSSFEIFNGVFQALMEFIEVRKPETLLFTGRDKVAVIYQTYLRKESANLEKLGYKLDGPHRVGRHVEFMLKRSEPNIGR
jgi:hypothetical protein